MMASRVLRVRTSDGAATGAGIACLDIVLLGWLGQAFSTGLVGLSLLAAAWGGAAAGVVAGDDGRLAVPELVFPAASGLSAQGQSQLDPGDCPGAARV